MKFSMLDIVPGAMEELIREQAELSRKMEEEMQNIDLEAMLAALEAQIFKERLIIALVIIAVLIILGLCIFLIRRHRNLNKNSYNSLSV